jgi:hypothetical protein
MAEVKVAKRKFRLVEKWREAWTWSSIWNSIAGFGIMGLYEFGSGVWNSLPYELRDKIPNAALIGMILFALNIVFRIYKYVTEDEHGNEIQ